MKHVGNDLHSWTVLQQDEVRTGGRFNVGAVEILAAIQLCAGCC